MKPRVTIREIAEKAGIHFTTVSLALRNSPRLKQSTRDRVQKLAKEMGYTPDPMLASLNAYRQTKRPVQYQAAIAWIHNWPRPESLYGSGEFHQYFLGAVDRAKQRGYQIEEFWIREPEMSINKLHRILRARNIQGALIAPQPRHGAYLDLKYSELSAVTFGNSMQPPVLDLVTNHQSHTINRILQHVLSLGYRRIGLCVPDDWNAKVENAWNNGMIILHSEQPDLPYIPPHWERWDIEETEGLQTWVEKERPDVIISHHNVYQRLRKMGLNIPEDIGFISPFLIRQNEEISGIYQNDFLIGQKGVDMVIGMLQRNEVGLPESPVRVLVEGILNPGKTLRKQTRQYAKKAKPSTREKSAKTKAH
ncbi:LacI family DNA-binding transcriptional regulator [Cerasicoccus maritimus]|uniref:LacI family DNA-binding transcriptional regulator n=1 Tax=Cerasicoccus maritimus TaxID=490089 RepID=UPI002852677B|nr:LacI family DNA-binding transcriptional regulator [Cerasicoccus maritimus]